MTNKYKRNESVSDVLTEVRTVLSRAKSALWHFETHDPVFIVEEGYWTGAWPNMFYVKPVTMEHPDMDHIVYALEHAVAELQPYENKKRKWKPPR